MSTLKNENTSVLALVDYLLNPAVEFYMYSPFPCNDIEHKVTPYLKNISVEKRQFLEDLRISRADVNKT